MRGEREYITQMKNKIIEAINKNEFIQFLMGENDYLVQSRELPAIAPGTGNMYNFMISALYELQKSDEYKLDFGMILINNVEQLIYQSAYGLFNSVEIIRSVLNSSPKKIDALGIKSEDLKELTEKIRNEVSRINNQLRETTSPSNSRMSIYDCLEFYNEYMYEHVGRKLT